MNLRNKKLVMAVRILFGAFMIFSGIGGLMSGPNSEGIPAPMVQMTQTLWQTGIFQMIKVTEIVAGAMLLFGLLPALATLFLAPLAVGIIIVNARISPEYLPMGIIVAVLTAYMGYVHWEQYKAIFKR